MLRCAERALKPLNYREKTVFYKVVYVIVGYAPRTSGETLLAVS